MYNPVSTYRIQFHSEFTFRDFAGIIPYLQKLGINTVYASPVFTARPGSTHGYDGLHPHHINSDIGTEHELRKLVKKLQDAGIGWLQDIVPNHMAFDVDNPFVEDILRRGRDSEYADFFDIDWQHPGDKGKLMLPVLGTSLDKVIESGELKLEYNNGKYRLKYYESIFPLRTGTVEGLRKALGNDPSRQDIDTLNTNKSAVKEIALQQHYRLCHWQETDRHINYRRFFTINGLICINVQEQDVFGFYHKKIFELVREDVFSGLRIDHIDGLYEPGVYLERLRDTIGKDKYVVVEKILQFRESLPQTWPVQGNTGYDFLAIVNNVFTNKDAAGRFTSFYYNLVQDDSPVQDQLRDKKALVLYRHMAGELDNLYRLLVESGLVAESELEKTGPDQLKMAIGEFLVDCRVYRYYAGAMPLAGEEKEQVNNIFEEIVKYKPGLAGGVGILKDALLVKPETGNPAFAEKALHFYRRCMQFTGPLMAKGFEDTLMYTYSRFIGHNEVGDSPEAFGIGVDEFHSCMKERQANWPLTINATSTHDTKRGEDVRARLNVLTDRPEEWFDRVNEWREMNRDVKTGNAPDANDEYFIYQALVGSYPMPGQPFGDYKERLQHYIQKALREGKTNSDWAKPDTEYENAVEAFIAKLLDKNGIFRKSVEQYITNVADYGIVNSLGQLVLKMTCPGVPDIYQGTELWDLSFVDPDNRRPVDYSGRTELLDELLNKKHTLHSLWGQRYSGGIKLWLTNQLLNSRKQFQELFEMGDYIPLLVTGRYRDNILAFMRRNGNKSCIVVVPLHLVSICTSPGEILSFNWEDTTVVLSQRPSETWEHISNGKLFSGRQEIPVSDIFEDIPLGVLLPRNSKSKRGAGVLLPVSSLHSPFGIGDIGPSAKEFADMLADAGQKYWQVLPLNPVSADSSYSPYSSISGMAGNPLLISPEILSDEGSLDAHMLPQYYLPDTSLTDYEGASANKKKMFRQAYEAFYANYPEGMPGFNKFCEKESFWLDDFALFVVLKEVFDNAPWHKWPTGYKMRNEAAIKAFAEAHEKKISKVKWLQFVFAQQWNELKTYCNNKGLQLIGDLPFYVSYDSADVWANRQIFNLDRNGNMKGIAGVPPDYFSKEGQLWGMPTFNWQVLKKQDYQWWIDRLKKNLEMFDILRLDHFRAFAAYWQVPAGEETAVNGKWIKGPGTHFFKLVAAELGRLPFLAEDLGDRMEDVYELRDKIGLPGMKVLQFAFGNNMPESVDVPHNFNNINCVVYTGTHDNNTTTGWFRKELPEEDIQRLNAYTGVETSEQNIAETMMKLAYASVADTVIVPVQDLLGLDERSRMNTPGTGGEHNWRWRLLPSQLKDMPVKKLKKWTEIYNRQ